MEYPHIDDVLRDRFSHEPTETADTRRVFSTRCGLPISETEPVNIGCDCNDPACSARVTCPVCLAVLAGQSN